MLYLQSGTERLAWRDGTKGVAASDAQSLYGKLVVSLVYIACML